jgi:hypothetical protein
MVVIQGKIVRQEAINLDGIYEKKRKQVEVQRKMSVIAFDILNRC